MFNSTRLGQRQDPELSIDQAIIDYKRLGYSDAWINQRIKIIEVRKELTDEWKPLLPKFPSSVIPKAITLRHKWPKRVVVYPKQLARVGEQIRPQRHFKI